MNDDLNSQLERLFNRATSNQSSPKRYHLKNTPLPKLNARSVDGIDHINFFTQTKTQLGSLLSTASRLSFDYEDQVYYSLKCLWAYYRTGCQIPGLRTISDYNLTTNYRLINSFPKQESMFALLVNAYYLKLKRYTVLRDALLKETLPFDYYIPKDSYRSRPKVAQLMVNGLNEVKLALLNDTKPRLEYFLSPKDRERAFSIEPTLRYEFITTVLLTEARFVETYEAGLADFDLKSLQRLKEIVDPDRFSPETESEIAELLEDLASLPSVLNTP